MRKLLSYFLICAVVLSILCGCSQATPPQTITKDELSITLPGSFQDLSHEDFAQGMEFLYGSSNVSVMSTKEDRAALQAVLPDLTAKEYAALLIESNGLSATAEERDGLITFRYSATTENTELTYLCGVFTSEAAFWTVQAYCPTADFSKNEAVMLEILKSVAIA